MDFKLVLAFALGGLTGGLVTYKMLKKGYDELREDDYEQVVAYFEDKYADKIEEEKPDLQWVGKGAEFDADGHIIARPANDPGVRMAKAAVERTNYNKRSAPPQEDKPTLEEMEQEAAAQAISIVGFDYFYNDNKHHTKMELLYYGADDVLITEDMEVLEDKATYIGSALAKMLREDEITDNPMYVTNPKLETDYEVHALPGSYAEEVLKQETPPDYETYPNGDVEENDDTGA